MTDDGDGGDDDDGDHGASSRSVSVRLDGPIGSTTTRVPTTAATRTRVPAGSGASSLCSARPTPRRRSATRPRRVGVVGFDVDRHDAGRADETIGADAARQLVLSSRKPRTQRYITKNSSAPPNTNTVHCTSIGDVVEREDRGDERRHGERQQHERAAEERQLDEGEDDGERRARSTARRRGRCRGRAPRRRTRQQPYGSRRGYLLSPGRQVGGRLAGAITVAEIWARSVRTVQTDRAQTWNQTDRAQIGGRHLPTDRHGQA